MKRWLLLLAACSSSAPTDEPKPIEPPKDAISKVTENGPVKATLLVWPAKPNLGEPIYLRLDIAAQAGVAVDAPFQEAGDQTLGRFKVVGFTRDTRRGSDGGSVQEQTYTLEAPTSGRHRIPPLRFEMVDGRGSGSATTKPQEVLTEEVPLDIAPVETGRVDAKLESALGELDPDVGGTPWLLILGIASGALVVGAGGALVFRGYRARRRIQLQRSAYEEAVAKLRVLEDRGAPGSDIADAWFVDLSAIVRDYLERRYEIRAPELTTEEFLLVATSRSELSQEHRGLLTLFLERCDRVKFAGYRPDADESMASLKSARAFVEDTRLREAVAA
jgi:hypothetical protein